MSRSMLSLVFVLSVLGCSASPGTGAVEGEASALEDASVQVGAALHGDAPVGAFEAVHYAGAGVIQVRGWAIDPSSTAAVSVSFVLKDEAGRILNAGGFLANEARADLGAAYPRFGPKHGLNVTVRGLREGAINRLCLNAENLGAGPRGGTALGCRSFQVPAGVPLELRAFGAITQLTVGLNSLELSGWAADTSVFGATTVDLLLNGTRQATLPARASVPRVPASYFGYSPIHGFAAALPLTAFGPQELCLQDHDTHENLQCRGFDRAAAVGALETADPVRPGASMIHVSGWALDLFNLGSTATAQFRVQRHDDPANVSWQSAPAALSRPDVGSAYPGAGNLHGFDTNIWSKAGLVTICLFVGSTVTPALFVDACKDVTVL